jgi:hypothetical protein
MPGYTRCADNRCIMVDFLCDGVAQCRDGSDESKCKGSCFLLTTIAVNWCMRSCSYLSWYLVLFWRCMGIKVYLRARVARNRNSCVALSHLSVYLRPLQLNVLYSTFNKILKIQ